MFYQEIDHMAWNEHKQTLADLVYLSSIFCSFSWVRSSSWTRTIILNIFQTSKIVNLQFTLKRSTWISFQALQNMHPPIVQFEDFVSMPRSYESGTKWSRTERYHRELLQKIILQDFTRERLVVFRSIPKNLLLLKMNCTVGGNGTIYLSCEHFMDRSIASHRLISCNLYVR